MATINVRLGAFINEQVIVSMEYNDVTMRVSGIICVNNWVLSIYVELIKEANGMAYGQVFPPGTNRIDIPTQGPTRIDILNSGRNHWGGIGMGFRIPN